MFGLYGDVSTFANGCSAGVGGIMIKRARLGGIH